ncbi:MAG TPA: phenylalanine--tRNA ligase subunit beta [Herpetosiphonaceae bacterium]
MRIPLSWLREFVDIELSPEELADRLTVAGLEVTAIDYVGVQPPANSPWTPDLAAAEPPAYIPWDPATILVGEVLEVQQHPNAERLTMPRIGYGEGREITVVTGAPNIKVGMAGEKVALALRGARLIDGHSETRRWITLKPTKLRGVASEGMVCSELELGLSKEHEGIILLPDDAPVGRPLAEYLGDVVLDIDVTPNLARALNIVGVAREVAAITGAALHLPTYEVDASGPPIAGRVSVEISDPERCPRFVAGLVEGVAVAPSPAWMQHRLRLAGQRPINNIADVTNYVMLEWGEPSHAFDADKIRGRRLIIRQAAPGERLETLDHVQRELRPQDTVVADPEGALSLAGVMGGAESEISDATVNVLFEAALWNPVAIRRTGQHFKLQSEASRRFEKGVDPAQPPLTVLRGMQLIREIAGGTIAAGLVDVYPAPAPQREIELALSEVRRLLGIELGRDEVAGLLGRLGFGCAPVESERGPALLVSVPSYRLDVEIEPDLIEDVARMYGYDRIPETLLADTLPPQRGNAEHEAVERIRDLLAASGLSEAISYAMTSPATHASIDPAGRELPLSEFVQLENPLTPERAVLRRSMLPELLHTLAADLRERPRVALFELGSVFWPVKGQLLPDEPRRLSIVLAGPRTLPSWQEPEPPIADFFDIKGLVEEVLKRHGLRDQARFAPSGDDRFHPGRSAQILIGERSLGVFGEIHPLIRQSLNIGVARACAAELDLGALLELALPATYRSISRFPAAIQDVALVAPAELPAADVERAIRANGGDLLESVELFDVYEGAPIPSGQRSLAFRLAFRAPDRTLSDKDLAKSREKLLRALERELNVQIRA